jgi:hypothetical protein
VLKCEWIEELKDELEEGLMGVRKGKLKDEREMEFQGLREAEKYLE